jgi:hypothetical protein
MNMLRKILHAVLYDDGAPSMYSGLLTGAPGDDHATRRLTLAFEVRKPKTPAGAGVSRG